MKSSMQSTGSVEEDLIRSIKGYEGYQALKDRDKTDKNFRKFISHQLTAVAERIAQFEKGIMPTSEQFLKELLQRINMGLKTIMSSLKNPCYLNQSYFSDQEMAPEKLAQLYQYDSQLKEQVEILSDETLQLEGAINGFAIADFLNHIYDLIDGVNQTMTEREFLIMSSEVI